MKLYYSVTSPFARKCRMMLIKTALIEHTELLTTTFESDELRKANPLGRIPALCDGDLSLMDSSLICEYIDHKYVEQGNQSLFRKRTGHYFETQLCHVNANGVLEAAVATVMEKRRDSERSEYWLGRWQKAIAQSITQLNTTALGNSDQTHIGTIAWSAALGYLDFRLPDSNWRDLNSELANWFEAIQQEKWFSETIPK